MLSHLIVLIFSYLGFLCLGFSMARHQGDLLTKELSHLGSLTLRGLGWLTLILAAMCAIRYWGWGRGLVAYSGHLSAAAALVLLSFILVIRIKQR